MWQYHQRCTYEVAVWWEPDDYCFKKASQCLFRVSKYLDPPYNHKWERHYIWGGGWCRGRRWRWVCWFRRSTLWNVSKRHQHQGWLHEKECKNYNRLTLTENRDLKMVLETSVKLLIQRWTSSCRREEPLTWRDQTTRTRAINLTLSTSSLWVLIQTAECSTSTTTWSTRRPWQFTVQVILSERQRISYSSQPTFLTLMTMST